MLNELEEILDVIEPDQFSIVQVSLTYVYHVYSLFIVIKFLQLTEKIPQLFRIRYSSYCLFSY